MVEQPAADLVKALARFESGFSYPLGQKTKFRISHGEDYPRFFRAMGQCRVFVSERHGEVSGTLAGVVRTLDGSEKEGTNVLYVGDLKVEPGLIAGLTLLRLAAALKSWAEPQVKAAFGVAMDGTRKTPERYTGRFGIPAFSELGKIMILRLACERSESSPAHECSCSDQQGLDTFRKLTRGHLAARGGNPAERSVIDPVWLRLESGAACGMLEDTRKAKRLFEVNGPELLSAHLSNFAFSDASSGAELLRRAVKMAGDREFPALFCSVPADRARDMVEALGSLGPALAPATVYGAGIPQGFAWHINTSEI